MESNVAYFALVKLPLKISHVPARYFANVPISLCLISHVDINFMRKVWMQEGADVW